MPNTNRDEAGRWAATNAGGGAIAQPNPSARTSISERPAVPDPSAIENPSTRDALLSGTVNPRPTRQAPSLPTNQPVTIPDYTRGINEVLGNGGGGGGGDAGDWPEEEKQWVQVNPGDPAAARARGWTGGEGPGQHQVITAEGPAYHGADVPGTGIPSPAGINGSDL